MESDLYPSIKNLALLYNGITKKGIKYSLKWANKHIDTYNTKLGKHYRINGVKNISEKQAYREFIFRGYIPYEEFEHKKKPGCCYICSNTLVEGTKFIYPKHFGHDYKTLRKYMDVYKAHDLYGIEGYTKVDIKYSL